MLAEDTDVTFRLLLRGWLTVYQNRSECYEEVPESWPVRQRQIRRWARGHNQVLLRDGLRVIFCRPLSWLQRLDGLLLLGVYMMPPALLLGWLCALALFYLGWLPFHGVLAILAMAAYGTFGNFAAFFEVAAAVRLDRSRERLRILPFLITGFLAGLVSICRASLPTHLRPSWRGTTVVWHKTERYR
jgi:cellulose synthase/poly-beta-1,6-N-acetylglucosamine synthase-like glycosyltransferase